MKLSLVMVYVSPEANQEVAVAHEFAAVYGPQHMPEDSAFNVVRLRCDGGSLPRDSSLEFVGTRRLPFLRDALEAARSLDAEWVGYIDSDILLTPFFADVFMRESVGRDLLTVQVSDIPQASPLFLNNPRRWTPRTNMDSLDGVLLRVDANITLPDFVIGEPFWDNAVVLMQQRLGSKATALDAVCALHAAHPGGSVWAQGVSMGSDYSKWEGLSPAGEYNRRLYFELQRG